MQAADLDRRAAAELTIRRQRHSSGRADNDPGGLARDDLLELHVFASREQGWCLTSKFPMIDAGVTIGVAGISRDLKPLDVTSADFARISAAIRFTEDHLADAPAIADLAAVARMSPYQLDRRMQQVFGLTTGQWILKTRIGRAQQLQNLGLRQTQEMLALHKVRDQFAALRRTPTPPRLGIEGLSCRRERVRSA